MHNTGRIRSYQLINYIIAGVIVSVLIYSGIFSASGNTHPVKCVHEQLTGMPCPSCGMSRSFSEIVRFNFEDAKAWNTYGPRVFIFFLFQLFLRVSNIFYLRKNPANIMKLARVDIVLSIITFVLAFWQFIQYNANLILH